MIEQNEVTWPEPEEGHTNQLAARHSSLRRPSRTLIAIKGGKVATSANKRRFSATSANLPVVGKLPATSPLPSTHSPRPSSSLSNASISLEQAYELLAARVAASESKELQQGALIVRMPQEEVGQRVYLQARASWQAHPYRPQGEAEVYRRAIQGHSITAAVFRNVSAREYLAWTSRHEPVALQITAGKATILNLGRSASSPLVLHPTAQETASKGGSILRTCLLLVSLAVLGAITGGILGLLFNASTIGALVGALAFIIGGLLRKAGQRRTR